MSDERHARVFVPSGYAYLGAFEGEGTCGEMPHGRLLRQSIMFDVRRQFACIDQSSIGGSLLRARLHANLESQVTALGQATTGLVCSIRLRDRLMCLCLQMYQISTVVGVRWVHIIRSPVSSLASIASRVPPFSGFATEYVSLPRAIFSNRFASLCRSV